MTSEERFERLTSDHRVTLQRLDVQEKRHRKTKWAVVSAIGLAVVTAGGTGWKQYVNHLDRKVQLEAEAQGAAENELLDESQWEQIRGLFKDVDKGLQELNQAVGECDRQSAVNATAIDFLTADQRWIRRSAEAKAPKPMRASRKLAIPSYAAVQQTVDPAAVEKRKAEKLEEANGTEEN